MHYLFSLNGTLKSKIWPHNKTALKELVIISICTLLLAISAQISIPLKPVPLTFQSATVLLIGMVCGARLGAGAIALYLILGSLGLPVFANFSGGIPMGPSSGYLLGFLPAVMVTGFLAEKGLGASVITSFISALIGAVVIFGFGLCVLTKFFGLKNAFVFGVAPFLISEPIKLLFVAFFAPRFWKKA